MRSDAGHRAAAQVQLESRTGVVASNSDVRFTPQKMGVIGADDCRLLTKCLDSV
jgi:hypothetical protein